MKPPSGPQPRQSPSPASQPPAPPRQQLPPAPSAPPAHPGSVPPRGEDFDISTLPVAPGANDKTRSPAHWSRAWMVVAGVLVAYCFYFFVYNLGVHAQKPLPIGPIVANSAAIAPATATVNVAGAVVRPGVYSLNASARIADAIAQAGGVTPDADTTTVNLAAFVQDGAHIVVPQRAAPASNPVAPNPASGNIPTNAAPPASSPLGVSTASTGALPAPAPTISAAAANRAAQIEYLRAHPINLNQATSFELQQLPGIGPAITTHAVTLY